MKTTLQRWRVRRILKWAGLCCCVLIMAAWGVSLLVQPRYVSISSWSSLEPSSIAIAFADHEYYDKDIHGWGVGQRRPRIPSDYGWMWPQRFRGRVTLITVPLWLPFVAVAIATAILFYRDRRKNAPGFCGQCGYDLTGNTSGRCPECGTPI